MKKRIEKLIKPYEGLLLECDGMTRVIHYLLEKDNIPHRVMCGSVCWKEQGISLHYWIETDSLIVDYRSCMWMGPDAPQGVMEATTCASKYNGEEIEMNVSEMIFSILIRNRE